MSASKELADEVARLRACVKGLISVAAMPALWNGREPLEIVGALADALLGTLGLAFVLVRLNEAEREQPIELARIAESFHGTIRQHDISEATLTGDALSRSLHGSVSLGGVDFAIASAHLGLGGELGVVIAGSRNLAFPAETERLLLDVAATEAAIAVRQVRLLSQQRRATEELDERVARRTSELARRTNGWRERSRSIGNGRTRQRTLSASRVDRRQHSRDGRDSHAGRRARIRQPPIARVLRADASSS